MIYVKLPPNHRKDFEDREYTVILEGICLFFRPINVSSLLTRVMFKAPK